ncbi:MAG: beta-galactosidase [Planctomycetota bacterium]
MISEPVRNEALRHLRQRHESPTQRRMRQQRSSFVAVVYWQPGDYSVDVLRDEFKRMVELGYNAVRFHTADPEEIRPGRWDFRRPDEWFGAAEDAGIGVIWHVPWIRPSRAMLTRHGLTEDEFAMLWPDEESYRSAIAEHVTPLIERYRDHPATLAYGGPGEPAPASGNLDAEYDQLRFARWLEEKYGTIEALDAAWNLYPEKGKPIAESFDKAWEVLKGFDADPQISGVHRAKVNYGAGRDLLRYFADKMNARVCHLADHIRSIDDEHMVLLGSHQLHANQAQLRWHFPDWAAAGDVYISSIHPAWHFELAGGEIDRPVYMQAKLTNDYFKGGHTSAYETTGGAVQYSGGYPNAMSAGQMRRFMLSYLAAGNESIAFWTWNHRPGGWESGEYGMTTLSGKLTPWAVEGGQIARAIDRYKDEIWSADQEARVGIIEDWDTEAILCFEPERHDLQQGVGRFAKGTAMQASRARIGASRAMINAQVPFQYVTADEIRDGLGPVWPVLYAAHTRAMSDETIDALTEYVQRGGRLIADVQFGFQDCWGKVRPTGPGSRLEALFGAWVDVIHDTRTEPMQLGQASIEGFFGDVEATDARVLARFADGRAAITEQQIGKGAAVLIGFDAGRMCHTPGCGEIERLLAELVTVGAMPTWRCTAPMTFRLRAGKADHYFLLNDGSATPALLQVWDASYADGVDAVTGEPIDVSGTLAIDLPARSGRWIRFSAK